MADRFGRVPDCRTVCVGVVRVCDVNVFLPSMLPIFLRLFHRNGLCSDRGTIAPS